MAKQETTKKEIKKQEPVKKLTASQAWNAIGGNKRLETFVIKKFSGMKALEEWKKIFSKDKIE